MAKQAREHASSESCLDSDECGPAATCLAAIGGMGGDGALSCRQSRDCVPTAIALMRDELAKADYSCRDYSAPLGQKSHACAVRADGQAFCWGASYNCDLGPDQYVWQCPDQTSAAPVAGLSDAVSISAGEYGTCAIKASGDMVCWGENSEGELGTGGDASSGEYPYSWGTNTPVSVLNVSHAVSTAAGEISNCSLLGDGTVMCWGWGGRAGTTLGRGEDVYESANPEVVVGLTDAVQLARGGTSSSHYCAIRATGAVVCWGYNYSGELGDGNTADTYPYGSSSVPVTVLGL